jgi:uncharacterized membrane-anchored protein YjiN (DUF445 family)
MDRTQDVHTGPNPRLIALLALGCSIILLVAAFLLLPPNQWWVSILQAGASAGIVGGLTDWFVVTAIFRGWPSNSLALPSTKILIRRYAQLREALLKLLTDQVLGKAALENYFENEPPLTALMKGLQKQDREGSGEDRAQEILATLIRNLASNLPLQELSSALSEVVANRGIPKGLTEQIRNLLLYLTEDGRLRRLLKWIALRLESLCRKPAMANVVSTALNETLDAYASRGALKGFIVGYGRNNFFADLQTVSENLLNHAAQQLAYASSGAIDTPGHRLIADLEEWLDTEAVKLSQDTPRLEHMITQVIEHMGKSKNAQLKLADTVQNFVNDVANPSSDRADKAAEAVLRWLRNLPPKSALDMAIGRALPGWIEKANLRQRFQDVLDALNKEGLAQMAGDYVAKDLNWIRVSGTIVGFLVGALLAALVMLVDFLSTNIPSFAA